MAMQSERWRSLLVDDLTDDLKLVDRVQDRLATRNLALARALAVTLIDERGLVDMKNVLFAHSALKEHTFVFVPGLELESLRRAHMLRVLEYLQLPQIQKSIQRIGFGLHNRIAERLVHQTLAGLSDDPTPSNDHNARVAVLTAWLTYLRQSVGSCFATAPAIAVHGHHPERFLEDMHQLLSQGLLRRVIEGVEISVPLLTDWGGGDLWRPLSTSSLLSPSRGFVAALFACGLIDEDSHQPFSTRAARTCQVISSWMAAPNGPSSAPFGVGLPRLSPAQVIRGLLLQQQQLTSAQVDRWERRVASMGPRALEEAELAHASKGQEGAIAKRCRQFLELEQAAQIAFKATADNALLRAWEYAVASFSEAKTEFQQWNLAISLGFQNEPAGLTRALQELINEQIGLCNEQIQEARDKADQIRPQLIYVQGKLQNAHSESEVQWLRSEYYQVKAELDDWEGLARASHRKGEKLAILSEWFVQKCIEGFSEQFQEVYDPELQIKGASIHTEMPRDALNEEAPAGFRLVAKEGRTLASSWTCVRDGEQFIDVLCRFLGDIETQLITWPEVVEIRTEFSRIITQLIQFARKEEFLRGALLRLQHRASFGKGEATSSTPWAFISGGSLSNLLQQYCALPAPPKSISRWFDDVRDFWVYLIDAVQELPLDVQERFVQEPQWPLLINSPDHAFCLRPGQSAFCASWRHSGYPYSWIRDQFEEPTRRYFEELALNPSQQAYLVESWFGEIGELGNTALSLMDVCGKSSCSPAKLRQRLLERLGDQRRFDGLMDTFDAHLLRCLPLTEMALARSALIDVYDEVERLAPDRAKTAQVSVQAVRALKTWPAPNPDEKAPSMWLPSWAVWNGLLEHWNGPARFGACDDLTLLQQAGERSKVLPPRPIQFADSNWTREQFAFVVNPGTLTLEIWCIERWGQRARPMASWRRWLDGSTPDRKWEIFTTSARRDFFS